MNFFQAIILGIVQALTEYLPVSSSAHIRIFGDLMLGSDPGAAFTAIIQIGTELAVILYFRHDIIRILGAWFGSLFGKEGKDFKSRMGAHNRDTQMGWFIIIGTLPILIAGLLFKDAIESTLRNLWITVTVLIIFGILLWVVDARAKQVKFLGPGTLYPDVAESGGGDGAANIKSHHNVGGLPDCVDFKEIIEPLRLLFKDEVRQLGRELGLPEYLVSRQPFPGPGLAIRIMGEITKEKADTLRLADAIYREELEKAGENKKMNQYFAVLTDTRTVGVMGDGRSYDRVLALRAVTTEDFMTADWARIPYELLDKISGRIVNEVKGINRIVYDITSKPPATVEWE